MVCAGRSIPSASHPEWSAAGAEAGRRGIEGSRECAKDIRRGSDVVQAIHGVLHCASAHRQSPCRRSVQNDLVFWERFIGSGASARAKAVGRRAVKNRAERESRGRRRGNPAECRNDVRSCSLILRGLTGSFDSVPPRLRPRGTALRMTSILMRQPRKRWLAARCASAFCLESTPVDEFLK